MLQLLVTANVHSLLILFTTMMEAIRSFETWVLTLTTRRNIPEDGIVHGHRRENLKSYMDLTCSECMAAGFCEQENETWFLTKGGK
jgi:hypothetical protein